MRQVVLDTETTGLDPAQGHRIIEIGCVELINRRITNNTYHQYINPEREVDAGALEVHGLDNSFLQDKPVFEKIMDDFLQFVGDSELIIHNAAFDIGFINSELKLASQDYPPIDTVCSVVDSLALARHKHPGQSNTLDALCKRYAIENAHRTLHGALLDSEILADVYLAMTGGQTVLLLNENENENGINSGLENIKRLDENRKALTVIKASIEELQAHNNFAMILEKTKQS